ncbi:MAG: glutamate racemase [Chloroflexi bacterium]|nr:glutamate racemase [Chloroflexota bacterium]
MIAVYDSGIGGTSVLKAIRDLDSHVDIIYLADQARCPYGNRPVADIRQIALGCANWLIRQGAQPVVVACNTASAAALHQMRQHHPETPFVGMVPAVKPAVQQTQHGVIGVMATAATLKGDLYHEVTQRFAHDVQVVGQDCHGLVDLVEAGQLHGAATDAAVAAHVAPLIQAGADVLVLGCTHYPFLRESISRAAPHVTIIDPAPAVARHTLTVAAPLTQSQPRGRTIYYTTGSASHLAWQINALGLPVGETTHVAVEELI